MKVITFNVVEYIGGELESVTSFEEDNQGAEEAKELFRQCVSEHRKNAWIDSSYDEGEDLERFVDDGVYKNLGYEVYLVRSS